MPKPADKQSKRYDYRQAKKNAIARTVSAAGREIGDLPPVADLARRAATQSDFRLFCETYLGPTFALAWSDDHLRVIAKIEAAVMRGEDRIAPPSCDKALWVFLGLSMAGWNALISLKLAVLSFVATRKEWA